MERKPDYEEMARKLAELEEIIGALRTREIDAIVGEESVLFLRLKETEERLRDQRDYLEELVRERTARLEAANEQLRIARDELETRVEERTRELKLSNQEVQKLVADLKIHQVELEGQAEELRRSRGEAQEARDKYRDLYDHAPVGYLTLEKNGRILEANETAAGLLRLGKTSLIDSQLTRYIVFESQDAFYFHMKRVRDNGGHDRAEVRMRRQDGSEFYALVESTSLDSRGGTRGQIRTIITDITERKRAEEDLKLKEYAIASAVAGIGMTDLEGRLTYVNHALLKMGGYEDEKEVLGKNVILFAIDENQGKEAFKRTFDEGSWEGELQGKKKDGSLVEFYAGTSLVRDARGKPIITMASFVDITERKRSEQELHQYREHLEELVEQRTRALRELAHRLVHSQEQERARIGNELHDEIGQLLTYTTLLIDRAMREPERQILAESKSMVQEAISGIRNLSSMLSPRLLRSAGLVRALMSLTAEYTRRTNIQVEVHHDDRLEEELPDDVALAGYRIVQEALTNVARHAGANEAQVRVSREAGWLRLEVQDNGAGFEPDTVGSSTGLTGMKERALALGGRLSIDSRKGQGTTVIAEIPLDKSDVHDHDNTGG